MRGLVEGGLVGGLGGAVLAAVFNWLGAGSPLAHAGASETAPSAAWFESVTAHQFLPAVRPGGHRPQASSAPLPSEGEGDSAVPNSPDPLAACDTDLRLVGSVVNEAVPRLSLAMLGRERQAGVVAVGGRIDRFTLVAVAPLAATLSRSDGELCALAIFDKRKLAAERKVRPQQPPTPRPREVASGAAAKAKAKGRPMFSRDELKRGVRLLGSGSYSIDRELFLRALRNPGGAAGGAYFLPFKEDGATTGMTVHRVRDGSTLAAMGIETGDVVQNVNGHGLDNAASLLAALRSARESDSVTLTVVRDGHARPVHYLIQ